MKGLERAVEIKDPNLVRVWNDLGTALVITDEELESALNPETKEEYACGRRYDVETGFTRAMLRDRIKNLLGSGQSVLDAVRGMTEKDISSAEPDNEGFIEIRLRSTTTVEGTAAAIRKFFEAVVKEGKPLSEQEITVRVSTIEPGETLKWIEERR